MWYEGLSSFRTLANFSYFNIYLLNYFGYYKFKSDIRIFTVIKKCKHCWTGISIPLGPVWIVRGPVTQQHIQYVWVTTVSSFMLSCRCSAPCQPHSVVLTFWMRWDSLVWSDERVSGSSLKYYKCKMPKIATICKSWHCSQKSSGSLVLRNSHLQFFFFFLMVNQQNSVLQSHGVIKTQHRSYF